jgi:hypothetical protein
MKIIKFTICIYILYAFVVVSPVIADDSLKPEVHLYLEAQKLETFNQPEKAAEKYQEALSLNPGFVLAKRKLSGLASNILTDHRKALKVEPGYTIKPDSHDSNALRGPIHIKDIMPGYLMVYKDPKVGEYALFSLNSRHMKNVHYLFVKEDKSWSQYPSISLPGVSRVDDILVYHQPGEKIQDGFIRILISAMLQQ